MDEQRSDHDAPGHSAHDGHDPDRAESLRQQAKARIHEVGDEIDRRLGDIGETARETAGEVVERARQAAEAQRSEIGREVHAVARALRGAAERLDGEHHPRSASLVRQGAEQVDRLGAAIDERTVPELAAAAGAQMRRHKWVVFGATLALGFVAARFLKATEPAPEALPMAAPDNTPYAPGTPYPGARG